MVESTVIANLGEVAHTAPVTNRFFLMLAILSLLTGVRGESRAGERPNVLMIVAESVGWQEASRHGGFRQVKTPALDALAAGGMELVRFFGCPSPSPGRAGLLTGRYHYRSGVSGESYGENVMHGYEITLAEVLRDNGYRTGHFGEWKNGHNWPSNARGQGFEEVVSREEEVDVVVAALDFLAESGEEPFLCWLTIAGDQIDEVDAVVARLESALEESGKRGNTVVVFVSDSGSGGRAEVKSQKREGDEGSGGTPMQLFGADGSVHEGGVRVPCVVRWPGRIPAGSMSREICSVIDWLPTLVELTGVDFVETFRIDGLSLAELLLTGGKPRRWPNRMLFSAFTPPGYDTKSASFAARTGRWLAVREAASSRASEGDDRDGWELYDLRGDPYQLHNVAGEYWYLAGHLSADFGFWMMQTTENGLAPVPTEIGHAEQRRVAIGASEVPYSAAVAGELRWPLEVVAEGRYRFGLENAEVVIKVTIGEKEFAISTSEVVLLPKGVGELEVKSDVALLPDDVVVIEWVGDE